MKTQVVYVLTSDNNDVYLEQTFVSICSLRKHNPDVQVILVVDQKTNDTITGKRAYILKYITQIIAIDVPLNFTKVQRSRFLKTSLREYIIGDFLFIDSDTIITSSLEELDNLKVDIAAVKDYHLAFNELQQNRFITKLAKKIGWKIVDKNFIYFNSGVIFVKDTIKSHNFYKKWHQEWLNSIKNGFHYDQPAFGKTNAEKQLIEELGGEWNCQILENGIPFLLDAKIIHYYASSYNRKNDTPPYTFIKSAIFQEIKEKGELSTSINDLIDNPKSKPFATQIKLISGSDIELLSSQLYRSISNLFYKNPTIFHTIERAIKFIKKIIK